MVELLEMLYLVSLATGTTTGAITGATSGASHGQRQRGRPLLLRSHSEWQRGRPLVLCSRSSQRGSRGRVWYGAPLCERRKHAQRLFGPFCARPVGQPSDTGQYHEQRRAYTCDWARAELESRVPPQQSHC